MQPDNPADPPPPASTADLAALATGVAGITPAGTPPFANFDAAVTAVLQLLRARLGFDLWMVTRISDDQQIVLYALDNGYGIAPGTVLSWPESICRQMVLDNGPRVAPDVREVANYAAAPIGRWLPISAYIGLPLCNAQSRVLGTLCAFDQQSQPAQLVAEQPLLELLARLLSSLLLAELARDKAARRNERLRIEAQTDKLSGLFNRRAWDRLLATEDERCRRHGHPAAVLVIDLDRLKIENDTRGHAAGDRLIERTGRALSAAAREIDIVARLGGDEFGVLGVECDAAGALVLAARVRTALQEAGVEASVGAAVREVPGSLNAAWELADRRMYEEKNRRRGGVATLLERG